VEREFNPLEAMPRSQDRGVQMVFLGAPGVGKGTNASRLSQFLKVPHIAMGDLVRNETSRRGAMAEHLERLMASGKLLPDEIIFELLAKRLESGVSRGELGFVLDGFPRTLHQAEALGEVAEIDLAVNLRLREDVAVAKCLGRRMCSGCGGNFNLADVAVDGIHMPAVLPPSRCASKMATRADDNAEAAVRARLRVYHEESKPVENFYRSQGLLLDFDVKGDIHETWSGLLSALHLEDRVSISKAALG
jgi:adenylate kinase